MMKARQTVKENKNNNRNENYIVFTASVLLSVIFTNQSAKPSLYGERNICYLSGQLR